MQYPARLCTMKVTMRRKCYVKQYSWLLKGTAIHRPAFRDYILLVLIVGLLMMFGPYICMRVRAAHILPHHPQVSSVK